MLIMLNLAKTHEIHCIVLVYMVSIAALVGLDGKKKRAKLDMPHGTLSLAFAFLASYIKPPTHDQPESRRN